MTEPMIRIENVSKKYRIRHEGRSKYVSLRDVIAGKVSNLWRKIRHFGADEVPVDSNEEDFWALKDVSFDVQLGEQIAIIGRNGAGKSTLLKILSRITEPTEGRITLHGRMASLLEVGTGFHPELTGRENIFLNGAIQGMSKSEIERKFDEIVAFSETEKFLDTPVKHFSSGMYVRLAFAVAAHLEQDILLVDEVLAVGDAQFQEKCLTKMSDVGKTGRTVLFVSHNMIAVKKLCQRAVVLDHGRSEVFNSVNEAIQAYLSQKSKMSGEISWPDQKSAPGNHQMRLKAVRFISDGQVNASPSVAKDIEIQVDYWNLQEGNPKLSLHIFNSFGYMLFSSTNFDFEMPPDAASSPKNMEVGIFRTSCIIPKVLLNPGQHTAKIFIFTGFPPDVIVEKTIAFDVLEDDHVRKGYLGEWLGAVRPILNWETHQLK